MPATGIANRRDLKYSTSASAERSTAPVARGTGEDAEVGESPRAGLDDGVGAATIGTRGRAHAAGSASIAATPYARRRWISRSLGVQDVILRLTIGCA